LPVGEGRVADPDGVGRRWIGRCYAHLLWPVGYLTGAVTAVVDEAVGAADGWVATEPGDGVPVLRRVWRRGAGDGTVTLTVLGWYPLLVTVAADGGGRPARRAVRRVVPVALDAGGRLIADRELAGRLVAAADRGAAAAKLSGAAAAHRAELAVRRCGACHALAGHQATHCDRCGRRFTAVDDADRAARHRQAAERLAETGTELARLAADRPMRATAPAAEVS
jgi:hypothetical protein